MKKIFFVMIILFNMGCSKSPSILATKGILEHIILEIGQEVEEELDLHTIQSALDKKITLDFYHYQEGDIKKARYLVYKITKLFLDKVQKAHLDLTENDLEIAIAFIDPKTHHKQEVNSLSYVALLDGKIHYSMYESEIEDVKEILQEELEEFLHEKI